MKKGLVSLVGSGPGDPSLLTLKALKRIRAADVIICDYLANPAHLRHASKDAEIIHVGKGFRHKALSQEKINRLITRKAHSGKNVVRLKGGDPYLFGRGGEEALILAQQKIPFEVIPGVTSATACAAYAGIPLTHRDHNASVTFLTGHRAHDENLDTIDWQALARDKGTLVIYMGFYNLKKITQHLLRAGMPSSTPSAVVEWGTLPRQKVCTAPLQSLASRAAALKLKAPCMIFIGEVTRLRSKLSWFEKLPLFGKRVLLTRLREGIGVFRDRFEELGAEAIEMPLIEIKPPKSFASMDTAIRGVRQYSWLVFSSSPGVRSFMDRLSVHHRKDSRWLSNIKVASIGSETSKTLKTYGIRPDLTPKKFDTQGILRAFKTQKISAKKILIPKAVIADNALELGLSKLGAQPVRIPAYQTQIPKKLPAGLKERVLKEGVEFVVFTSSSTVHHFVRIFGMRQARKISRSSKFLSIGPVTSAALRSYKFKVFCEAEKYTLDGLIEMLKEKI